MIELISILLVLCYGLGIITLYHGWHKGSNQSRENDQFTPSTSLIIAFRNEEKQLPALIDSIKKLNYPAGQLEVILCNDHSTDGGPQLIDERIQDIPFKTLQLNSPQHRSGKKKALQFAANQAEGQIILLTDADCNFQPDWIRLMTHPFQNEQVQMIQGPVLLTDSGSGIGKLEQIEFISLMMSCAGSLGVKSGILASGANIAVRKQIYLEAVNNLQSHIASGDDMFLLEFMKKHYNHGIIFNKKQEATVTAAASGSFSAFWNQRKRWTSKSLNYSDPVILLSALLVFLTNLSICAALIASIFDLRYFTLYVILFTLKTICETPLMISGFRFYRIKRGMAWFLITQTIYPFYIVGSAIAGMIGSYQWKSEK